MKYILLLAALWCHSVGATAQTAYLASYRFIKPYDTAAFADGFPAPGEGKRCVKYSNQDTSAVVRKRLSIANKIFVGNTILQAYCTKELCITECLNKAHNEIAGVRINVKQRSSKTVINAEAHKEAIFIDDKKERCQPIKDNLHFSATDKHKRIGNWECAEYVPKDDNYKGLSVWACADLPSYVHPGMYGREIKGGIVALEYGKDQLILDNLKVAAAADRPALQADWHLTDKRKIDLFKSGAAEMVMR